MTKRRVPVIKSNTKILIICEGQEEKEYIDRLKQCAAWDCKYDISVKNVKSIDEIAPRYQYEFQNGSYEIILVFCDTEKEPYSQFKKLMKSIDDLYGSKAASKVVFFANPCTMQIILSHFSKVKLTSNQKTDNAKLIFDLTGVKEYFAKENQRSAIMRKINAKNYETMKGNIADLSSDYKVIPSTNFSELLNHLEQYDKKWITYIKNKINE